MKARPKLGVYAEPPEGFRGSEILGLLPRQISGRFNGLVVLISCSMLLMYLDTPVFVSPSDSLPICLSCLLPSLVTMKAGGGDI